MNIKVVYNSKTGNTKKVAEVMAHAVGVSAEAISQFNPNGPVDLLLIGSGIYMHRVPKKVANLIKSLDGAMVKNAAVFVTYGGHDHELPSTMKEMLKKQGINVIDEVFQCRGQAFFIINRKHPNEQDLSAAKEYALNVVEKINKV